MKKIIKKIIKKNHQRQINQEDLIKIRKFFHKKINLGVCPVMGIPFDEKDMVVDHVHPSNAKNLNREFESGLIRGVINRHANSMEGKITNSYIRYGLHKSGVPLHTFLRNLADFIEDPPMTNLQYLHPSERKTPKNLKKTSINQLVKLFKKQYPDKKLPEVLIYKRKKTRKGKYKDKEKKLTSGLERLFAEFKITPEFKKG